jgi:hypothetical protein
MEEEIREMPGRGDVDRVLLQWIGDPSVDRTLGRKSIQEIAGKCDMVRGF